jgi:ankyrin repeat protein
MAPVYAFLKSGGDPNARNEYGGTLLETATNWNYRDIVQALLSKGADPNQCRPSNECALFISTGRDTEILRMLVAAGADVNRPTRLGTTPLGRAAGNRREIFERVAKRGGFRGPLPDSAESVRILIAAGADVNHIDGSGRSPLRTAIGANNLEIARQLLEAGADVHQPMSLERLSAQRGGTVLMEAVESYPKFKDLSAVQLLLDFGADPNDRNLESYDGYEEYRGWVWRGYSVLGFAAKKGLYDVVRLLLERGADPTVGRNDGQTPVELAEQSGRARTANLIRQYLVRKQAP